MTKHFTHLHIHTEYSLLDGAITLPKMVARAKEFGLKSLAITDHGNIFGAVKFFDLCKKAGIKPVLGIEAYLTEDVEQRSVEKKYYHMILLVQNEIGYHNLCKLISFSYKKGFYFKPRIDYAVLEKYSEGLIATTACLGGHIPQLLKNDRIKEAEERINWFLKIFGRERFYLEVQPDEQDEQKVINKKLFELSKKFDIDVIATTDAHYLTPADHEAHEIMLAVGIGKKFDDPTRFTFGKCRPYMRSEEEMHQAFPNNPEAIYNTGKVADLCDFRFKKGKLFFPEFELPKEKTDVEHFKDLCLTGLDKLIEKKRIKSEEKAKYLERLNVEMNLIISMGFVGYFLIVSDFIMWSRANDIPVGPGRGSAAGALVAWCLEITNIDPLKYNLLFERFLNPERISMPDIDIDFCIEGREVVINHIKEKYGHDKVCQIITFGTMLAKGVIKDVARALGLPFEESNMLTSLIPDQLKISLKEALEQEPRLKNLIDNNKKIKHIFDIAFRLEGLTRHASKHAAGIVITPKPTDEMLPIFIPSKEDAVVAQYAMTELESIGFLKIDLLGLKNLTLIKKALKLIKKHHNIDIDINHIPLDDQKTFELIQTGKTSGVFQLESDGIKEVLRKLKPDKFEDIIAVNALYRPGPLGSGMVDSYILRRHGRERIEYLFPELEPILKETYGVIIYQEQVMKIASTIGGYSLGESDILRRAMSKKKIEVMTEQKKIFTQRAKDKNFNTKKAEELFDLMAYFAGYGFNKSHSAAYALIAFQTAYLKANYCAEFLASLLSLEATNAEKMTFYLKEARDMNLEIVAPDINKSEIDFSVVDKKILFGLKGIKSIGLASLKDIIEERNKKGSFNDLLNLCERIDLRTSNKRVLENLISAGALDKLNGTRAQQYHELPNVIEKALEIKERKLTGQMSLFAPKVTANGDSEPYEFKLQTSWSDREQLEKEKEVIGFYISSHPLQTYKNQLDWFKLKNFEEIEKLLKNQQTISQREPWVTSFGLLITKKVINTKKGDRMAFVQLEDLTQEAEIIVFPRLFAQVENWLDEYSIFMVKGVLDLTSSGSVKIKANQLIPLELLFQEWPKIHNVTIKIPENNSDNHIKSLKEIPDGKIPIDIVFKENEKFIKLKSKKKVELSFEQLDKLNEIGINGKIAL